MAKSLFNPGFECCFCQEAIGAEDEAQAVVLSATNLSDWRIELEEAREQQLFAHMACLMENWKGRMSFEAGALVNSG
ncbi:hypothetical protein [Maricaulis sp.]|uniref:hypothetical protein n=1 Tax=Maricaulis sp. TaxID=1486257 RepID=UPI00260D5F52|nr:hypothetical protein [Maricaulis sp.]